MKSSGVKPSAPLGSCLCFWLVRGGWCGADSFGKTDRGRAAQREGVSSQQKERRITCAPNIATSTQSQSQPHKTHKTPENLNAHQSARKSMKKGSMQHSVVTMTM